MSTPVTPESELIISGNGQHCPEAPDLYIRTLDSGAGVCGSDGISRNFHRSGPGTPKKPSSVWEPAHLSSGAPRGAGSKVI